MGHSNYRITFNHYRKLIRPEVAAEFWTLTPDAVRAWLKSKVTALPIANPQPATGAATA